MDPEGSKGGSWRGAGGTPQPPWLFRRKAIPTVKKEFSGGIEQPAPRSGHKQSGELFVRARVDPHTLSSGGIEQDGAQNEDFDVETCRVYGIIYLRWDGV